MSCVKNVCLIKSLKIVGAAGTSQVVDRAGLHAAHHLAQTLACERLGKHERSPRWMVRRPVQRHHVNTEIIELTADVTPQKPIRARHQRNCHVLIFQEELPLFFKHVLGSRIVLGSTDIEPNTILLTALHVLTGIDEKPHQLRHVQIAAHL
jgi:hypothetical protein